MIEWRAIAGYEGYYEVSSTGLVRSLDRVVAHPKGSKTCTRRSQIIRPCRSGNGRLTVTLARNGTRNTFQVHILVAETFIGPKPDPKFHCCHNDGNCLNNNADNLRWDTVSANRLDCVRHGNHNYAKRTACNYGHEFTPENTYIRPTGARACRACGREKWRRRAVRAAS